MPRPRRLTLDNKPTRGHAWSTLARAIKAGESAIVEAHWQSIVRASGKPEAAVLALLKQRGARVAP